MKRYSYFFTKFGKDWFKFKYLLLISIEGDEKLILRNFIKKGCIIYNIKSSYMKIILDLRENYIVGRNYCIFIDKVSLLSSIIREKDIEILSLFRKKNNFTLKLISNMNNLKEETNIFSLFRVNYSFLALLFTRRLLLLRLLKLKEFNSIKNLV